MQGRNSKTLHDKRNSLVDQRLIRCQFYKFCKVCNILTHQLWETQSKKRPKITLHNFMIKLHFIEWSEYLIQQRHRTKTFVSKARMFPLVCDQVCIHCSRDFGPRLHTDLLQIFQLLGLLPGLAWPLQDLEKLLTAPATTHLQSSDWGKEVAAQNLAVLGSIRLVK